MHRIRILAAALAVATLLELAPAAAEPTGTPPSPMLTAAPHLLNFDPTAPLEADAELLAAMEDAEWREVEGRNYPPHYFHALTRYRVGDDAVARMRAAIAGIPRVDPERYDILFNSITRTWDIVCWVKLPEPAGVMGVHGFGSRTVEEPIDVYQIPARYRDPTTLSDADFQHLRRWCTSTRGTADLNAELRASEDARRHALNSENEAREHDFLAYYKTMLMRMRDETGLGDLSPEEMARRTGTSAREWAPVGED